MLLLLLVLVRMINVIDVIISCEMISVIGMLFLFILVNVVGSRFFCVVIYILWEGLIIQEVIFVRIFSNSSVEIMWIVYLIFGVIWDIRMVKVCIIFVERLILLFGMIIVIDKLLIEFK